jgi:hypothetical protein
MENGHAALADAARKGEVNSDACARRLFKGLVRQLVLVTLARAG